MTDLSDKTACVIDRGLFPAIALCLAEQFGKVFYVGPEERVMPRLAEAIVGDGFEKIIRAPDLWTVKDESDIFVFTDIGHAGEQAELVRQGRAVWGHHGADVLEVNKGEFLRTLKMMDMAVPPHQTMRGISKLRAFLNTREDFWVKVSRFRGDWETFHWRNRELDTAALDCAAYRLGPLQEKVLFYVFDKIETEVEDGIDTWRVGDKWPKRILHAMERKDKSLLGAMQDFADVSEEVRGVNEKFGPVLDAYGYQGPVSTEVRIAEDDIFFIDPTLRFGSPPHQLQTVLIKNLPEIIYHGAHGDMVEPESEHEFGAQVLITSDREKDEWLTFQMPDDLRPFVKAAFCCEVDDVFTIAPNPLENWAGWLVATGDTIEETIDTLKERQDMLPDGFDCDLTSLCDLLRELESAKDEGITITDQPVPKPETVLKGE